MARPTTKIDELREEQRDSLKKQLHNNQNGQCYICKKAILLDSDPTNIDHITALDKGGVDDINNWGLTHSRCNKSKGTKDLQLQRYLFIFQEHLEKYTNLNTKSQDFTVGNALDEFFPNRKDTHLKIESNKITLHFDIDNKQINEDYQLLIDQNDASCKSFVGMMPFKYIFHDKNINPRSIVDLEPMIQEFYEKNPQLQPSLAYVQFGEPNGQSKIMLFDGQHKAAAQLYVGKDRLFCRVFINPDIQKLKEVNFRAHTKLAQIHFPQMINDKVGHDIFEDAFAKYSVKHDYRIVNDTEKDFLNSFIEESEKKEYKRFFKNYLKFKVITGEVDGQENKILQYVETVHPRSKTFPLSYDSLTKGLLNNFLYLSFEEDLPIEESKKYRQLERENAIKLMNIFVEEILQNKFDKSIGIAKIEQKLKETPDRVADSHLRAFRMCRQQALIIWVRELKLAIHILLDTKLKYKNSKWKDDKVLWANIDNEEWNRIRRMINVISQYKLWTEKLNRTIIEVISTTKKSDWERILLKGILPGTVESHYEPLDKNYIFHNSK